jgi:colicin import membrane protein
MHAVLFVLLVFGVRWQSRAPESVQVELWSPPVAVQPVEEPKTVPKPEPAPVVQPEAAKPEPALPKPEIVEKKAPPPKPVAKPERKPVAKAEPKPVPKPEPLKPKMDDATKRMHAELAREQASLAVDRELKDLAKRQAATVDTRALGTWMGSIQRHIRSRINKDIADVIPGNPEAIFMVTLLPNCEVLNIAMLKSSGSKAYDDEVERAIRRASPLPKPEKADVFDRQLRLTFRPKDL